MRTAILFMACLCACGDGSGPPQARYERVSLEVAPRPRPATEVVQRFVPTRALEGWEVVSETKRFAEHGAALALHLRGTKPRSIKVEAPFGADAYNGVRVHGVFNARLKLTLRLFGSKEKPFFERETAVNVGPTPQVVYFGKPWRPGERPELQALELGVEGGGPFDLLAFELVNTPIAQALPLPEDGPQLVPIQNEARSGVGLVADAPLFGTVEVTDAAEILTFSIGVPGQVDTHARGWAWVEFSVGEGGAAVRRKLTLPANRRWLVESVPLGGLVGERVPVHFALEGTKGEPAGCVIANVELVRPGGDTPSVALISSDTHRADHLGLARGDVDIDTPNLDGLAGRGVMYDDAWSTTNVTSPSHVALMTGVNPRDSRVIANTGHLDDGAPTLAEAFAAEGWATVGVVSVRHLGPRGIGLGQGFDRMVDPPAKPWDAEDAVDLLLERVEETSGAPLFAWLHLFDAHDPYEPPGSYDRKYYPSDKDPFDPTLPEPGWEMGNLPFHMLPIRDPEFPLAQYRGEVAYLDDQLARVIDHPRLREGWFAFTSDHGEILETQGSWFNHGELFPATLHVPLILAGPGVPAGERSSAPVEQAHVARTLLDLAGFGRIEFPGENLLSALESPEELARFSLSAGGFSAALTEGRWFLVLTLKKHKTMLPRQREQHEVELYDLVEDPECTAAVTAEHPEVARDLRARLIAWLEAASPEGFASHAAISTEDLKALAALGYAGDMPEVGARRWIDPACACEQCEGWR